MDIFERISAYKAENEKLAWTGTFKDYIELLRNDPTPATTAHARVYEMIKSYGVEESGSVKRYKFFLNRKYSGLTVRLRSWSRSIFIRQPGGLM